MLSVWVPPMAIDGTERVVQLFIQVVPEIADGTIQIKAIARILGYRCCKKTARTAD